MSKQIFINLPVHDLAKAKAFYTALGHRAIAVVRGPSAYWSATERDRAFGRLADPAAVAGSAKSKTAPFLARFLAEGR